MGVERRKVIWVRMLSFSPWCRHVADSRVLVSPSLGLAALFNKASPLWNELGHSHASRLSHHLWLLLTTVRELTWAHVNNLCSPDNSFSRRICALFVYSGRCRVDSARLTCDRERLWKTEAPGGQDSQSDKCDADDALYGRGYWELFSSGAHTVNCTYCSLCSQSGRSQRLGWGGRP